MSFVLYLDIPVHSFCASCNILFTALLMFYRLSSVLRLKIPVNFLVVVYSTIFVWNYSIVTVDIYSIVLCFTVPVYVFCGHLYLFPTCGLPVL